MSGDRFGRVVRCTAGVGARCRRPALVALSVVTALWFAGEVAVSVTERSGSWPVTGFAMFSAGRAEATTFRLEAATGSGGRVPVAPADFGFRYSDQLDIFVWTRVYDRSRHEAFPDGRQWLARLAAGWSGSHPAQPAVPLTLDVAGPPPHPPRRAQPHP